MALDLSELSTTDTTAQAELVRRRELTPLFGGKTRRPFW